MDSCGNSNFNDKTSFREFDPSHAEEFNTRNLNIPKPSLTSSADASSSIFTGDMSSIGLENVKSYQDYAMTPKYRGIDVHAGQQLHHLPHEIGEAHLSSSVMGPPKLAKAPRANVQQPEIHVSVISDIKPSEAAVSAPPKPAYVTPSSFLTLLMLSEIVSIIQERLNKVFEVSYEFVPNPCQWTCFFLRGSTRCKFELNVYKASATEFLIEGNRLSGDSASFRTIYQEVKAGFSATSAGYNGEMTVEGPSLLSPSFVSASSPLSDKDSQDAIQLILSLADCPLIESKIQAAQMLCDLSLQEDMHQALCESGCVAVLLDLVKEDCAICPQHAMCALANLSSSHYCQEKMLTGKALGHLFAMSVDGSFDTLEMRRESARTLANLCTKYASKVRSCSDNVSSWIDSVEGIRDDRLRLHAGRAKVSLLSCSS